MGCKEGRKASPGERLGGNGSLLRHVVSSENGQESGVMLPAKPSEKRIVWPVRKDGSYSNTGNMLAPLARGVEEAINSI